MNIGKRAFSSLATALVLGAAIVGLTAAPAAADNKKPPKDDGTRCVVYGGASGDDMTFYMPGEVYTDQLGRKLRCGSDGEWYVVSATQPRVPGQVPAHTFEQVP